MTLLNLNNAHFVKVYEDSQRVYAWFGGLGVSIYDYVNIATTLELNEIDYFTMSGAPDISDVIRTIELHEDKLFTDEAYTADMFINHEMEQEIDHDFWSLREEDLEESVVEMSHSFFLPNSNWRRTKREQNKNEHKGNKTWTNREQIVNKRTKGEQSMNKRGTDGIT